MPMTPVSPAPCICWMCVLSERADLVIAGVGNRYRCDDAVGLHLVEQYRPGGDELVASELWEDFDGAAVAHRLVELDRPVLIVDCADLGMAGGAFRVLAGRKIQDMPTRSVVSTHGIGLAQGVQLAATLGYGQSLQVFGVQPFAIEMGGELSAPMLKMLPELQRSMAGAVAAMLRQRVAG